jgi:hypothetical protein
MSSGGSLRSHHLWREEKEAELDRRRNGAQVLGSTEEMQIMISIWKKRDDHKSENSSPYRASAGPVPNVAHLSQHAFPGDCKHLQLHHLLVSLWMG